MPITLKFSNSLSQLADAMMQNEAVAGDAFQAETIVVSSTGLRRWLSLRMASGRGIFANCEFPTPQTFVQQLLERTLEQRESAAFSKPAMLWRIYNILKTSATESADLQVPHAFISGKADLGALQLAERVADLFDQYLTYRPDWILAWEQSGWVTRASSSQRAHEVWQRALWKRLNADRQPHRAQLYQQLLQALANGPVRGIAETVTVFGTHTLPPIFLKLLKALGQHHTVVLHITQPTPAFWGDHPTRQQLQEMAGNAQRLRTDACADGEELAWGNELLASWGGQGRDLFNLLLDEDLFSTELDDAALFREPAANTLLAKVQRAVYHLQANIGNWSDPDVDDSLRLHCCHHPLREIEVLHDCLLRFFSADNNLTPADILVLAPDINVYAPYIDAVFAHPEQQIPLLPYSIADRNFRTQSKVLDAFQRILEICHRRFAAAEIFALLQSPAMRNRFEWSDADLASIKLWLGQLGTAWGRDAEHRASLDLPAFQEYSWQASFERLFLGYAIRPAQAETTAADTPYDAVEGSDSVLIGKLKAAYDLLQKAALATSKPLAAKDWASCIETVIVGPFFEVDQQAALEVRQIRSGLKLLQDATAGIHSRVDLPAIIHFLLSVIEDGIPGRGFMGRGITFATLTPMRAIPHKVVCLIGMEESAFPRELRRAGFDLMRADGLRRTGDRASYQSDRYLFLETLLSAGQKLHISYCGFSARDDSVSAPSIPIDELLNFLKPECDQARQKHPNPKHPLLVDHRLHGHHPLYFDATREQRLFSHSPAKCAAALALHANAKSTEATEADKSLPPPGSAGNLKIDLQDFIRFFNNPAQYYAQMQLGIQLPFAETELPDAEPLEINSLDRYKLLDQSLRMRLHMAAKPPSSIHLPPTRYGKWLADELQAEAVRIEQTFMQVCPQLATGANPVSVDVHLPFETAVYQLSGTIADVFDASHIRLRVGKIRELDQLSGWIRHVVLSAAYPQIQYTTWLLGWDKAKSRAHCVQWLAVEQHRARELLNGLLQLYLRGQQSPLPLLPGCSFAYCEKFLKSGNSEQAFAAVAAAWDPYFGSDKSPSQDPWTRLCWPDCPPFAGKHSTDFAECALVVFTELIQSCVSATAIHNG